MSFCAHKLVHSEPFFGLRVRGVIILLSALCSDLRKKVCIGDLVHIYITGAKLLRWNFLKSLRYLEEAVRTNFSDEFWTFRNF